VLLGWKQKMIKIKSQKGNMSIFSIVLIILFTFTFLMLSDLSRIFIGRTIAKNAANSAALAVCQDILYFELEDINNTAKMVVESNNSNLESIEFNYDDVTISVSKNINFVFVKIFGMDSVKIYASSKGRVEFPWDEKFNTCKRIKFNFGS